MGLTNAGGLKLILLAKYLPSQSSNCYEWLYSKTCFSGHQPVLSKHVFSSHKRQTH